MVDLPVVLVGCPVQNREHTIEKYLKHIYKLDYPKEKIIPAFFVNNSSDKTGKIIKDWQKTHNEEYNNMLYLEKKKVYKGKTDNQKWTKRDFTLFAVVRNLFIKFIIRYPFHYLLSIDSDIYASKNTLKKLLENNKDICSTLIWNRKTVYGTDNYNYRKWMSDAYGKFNYFQYSIQPTELFEVDITGACYLLKREVLDAGCRYKAHKLGEDWDFCLDAKKKGFKLFCDPTIKNFHNVG